MIKHFLLLTEKLNKSVQRHSSFWK